MGNLSGDGHLPPRVRHRWAWTVPFLVLAVSQILMATPMIILYNFSILLAWNITRKREKAAAEQKAREDA